MYAIDLFETNNINEGAYAQLTPGSSALATANFATLAKAFRESLPEIELDFGNQPLRLNGKEINFLANYYDQLNSKELKTKFIYEVMPRFNQVYELLVKRGFRDPMVVSPDTQPELPGLQEKKSSVDKEVTSPYKDVRVQRAVKKAVFDNPAASSDEEAFIKSMLDAQEKDQKDIASLRRSTEQQRELLSKNLQLDREQDDHITNIEKEINKVDQESDALRKLQQQMASANAQLQQKLAAMRGKKSVEVPGEPINQPTSDKPEVGVSVATDKEPSGYKYRQARLTAAQRAMSQRLKQLDPARLKDPSQGRGLGQMASQIAGPEAVSQNDEKQSDLFAAEDLTHGLEESAIPVKQVIQGYVVEFDPRGKVVTISQRGQKLKQYQMATPSRRAYDQTVNKFIRSQEDDKYPDDIEDRDVRLPMKKVAEGSVFGQQDFDTQMDLAKLKTKLTHPKPAQGAPVAEPQPIPARLSDLQSRREKFANLADIKKEIETLQARATRGGRILPRGLAADLEDYFTVKDVDVAYDDMMSKYQKQLAALQQYLGMRKVLWSPKKDIHENKSSEAYEQGGRAGYYGRPYNNPYKSGTDDHADYKRGYRDFRDEGKDYGIDKPKKSSSIDRDRDYLEDIDRSGQKMYKAQDVYMLTHNGQEVAFYTLKDLKRAEQDAQEMQKNLGGEVHLRKVIREGDVLSFNRAGFNQFRDRADWLDKRDYIQQQLLDPRQRDNYPEIKQRLLDINAVGRKLGYIK